MTMPERDEGAGSIFADTVTCLAFYTRLPLPQHWLAAHGGRRLAEACAGAPLAGLTVGLLAGFVLWLASVLQAGALLSAGLGVLTLVAATGALHEDGLSDMADAMGARDRTRRLEIMRDSRLGTFGAIALFFSLGLRVAALAGLVEALGAASAALALAAAASVSRMATLWPLHALEPARADGAGAMAGRPTGSAMLRGVLTAGLIALLLLASVAPLAALLALAAAAGAAYRATLIGQRLIGGHTGDVAGAAGQAAEIAFLTVLVMVTNLTR